MQEVDYGHLKELMTNGRMIPMVIEHNPTAGYTCPNCHDVRAVFGFRLDGGPYRQPLKIGDRYLTIDGKGGWYSGRLVEEPCPACEQGRIQDWLAAHCGMDGTDLRVMLSDFMTNGRCSGKAPAHALAAHLLSLGRSACGFVTFYGQYGVGKSHLLKAIVNGYRAQGVYARYSTMNSLLETIKTKYSDKDGLLLVQEMIEAYQEIPVLCLDEFERFNPTPWNMDTSFRLLDSRFNASDHLLTVLASNIDPAVMTSDWGYLRSRILGGEFREIPGPDMRPLV